jgi:hypothetical protein
MAIKSGIAEFHYPLYSQPWRKGEIGEDGEGNHYHTCFARLMGRETFERVCPIMWRGISGGFNDPKLDGCGNCDECDNCIYSIRVDYINNGDGSAELEIAADKKLIVYEYQNHSDG